MVLTVIARNELDEGTAGRLDRRARLGVMPCTIAIAAASVSAYPTLVVCALIACFCVAATTVYERAGVPSPLSVASTARCCSRTTSRASSRSTG